MLKDKSTVILTIASIYFALVPIALTTVFTIEGVVVIRSLNYAIVIVLTALPLIAFSMGYKWARILTATLYSIIGFSAIVFYLHKTDSGSMLVVIGIVCIVTAGLLFFNSNINFYLDSQRSHYLDDAAFNELATLFEIEGLDEIPWDELRDAYGPASNVPAYLRLLVSPNPFIRKDAIRNLWETIHYAGSLSSATAYAIPFIVRLALDSRAPDREQICWLLWEIAETSVLGFDKERMINYIKSKEQDLPSEQLLAKETTDEERMIDYAKSKEALIENLSSIKLLAKDTNEKVAEYGSLILDLFSSKKDKNTSV